MAADRPRVKPASEMDDETFLKHMNARHEGAAGISHYGRSNIKGDDGEALLRTMHRVLHDPKYHYHENVNHDHRKEEE